MHCTRLNLAAIVAAIHIPRALGLNLGGLVLGDELAEGGSQFIRFNGTVESSFTFSTATPPCGDLSTPGTSRLEPLANSTLYVGANPSWDPNPWFFWLHGPVDVDITFRSAAYTCYKNGTRCSSYESWPWYYVREQILNISATSTQRLRGPEPGGAAGKIGNDALFYSAVADQSTFTGNGSSFILPGFSLLVPESVDASGKRLGCSFFQAVTWNASTPFSYSLNFTNASVSFSLSSTISRGRLDVWYTGVRVDRPRSNSTSSYDHPYDNGHDEAIALAPVVNYSVPHFTFANGSELHFRPYSDGEWDATASDAGDGLGTGRKAALRSWSAVAVALFAFGYLL